VWKALQHQNVLSLTGVTMSVTRFEMISDWMMNGNINDFVKAHPKVDRLELVGFLFKASCLHFKFADTWTTCSAERCC